MKTFEYEPIRGLPEKLPEGEHIIWQGTPSWRFLAKYVFRTIWVAAWLAFFVVLRGIYAYGDGYSLGQAVLASLSVLPIALLGVGILLALAWVHARTTIYTLTNRRWVLRIGVALPMMVNLPFTAVVSAEFRERAGGEGDLPIKLKGQTGPSYLHLWPHARPWKIAYPQPMLRGVAQIQEVARLFAEALVEYRSSQEPSDNEADQRHAEEATA